MSHLVKLVGSGIGLATEVVAARKSSSTAQSNGSSPAAQGPPMDGQTEQGIGNLPDNKADELFAKSQAVTAEHNRYRTDDKQTAAHYSAEEKDEEDWEIDDAAEKEARETTPGAEIEVPSGDIPSGATERKAYVDKIVRSFIAQHPPPSQTRGISKLPCPVIIPQRRPRNKSRGFVRAYPPVLSSCGINQAAFLQFVKSLHQASKASPIFDVILYGALIAGMVPSLSAMIASAVVTVAAASAIKVQSNKRTNSFLDQMNEKFFIPRGLFCVIMSYNPQAKTVHEPIDISRTMMKSLMPPESKIIGQLNSIRGSSGKTYGEVEMPEAAPLIFPDLDAAVAAEGADGKKQSGLKKSGKFIADYLDRRAQASYPTENPNSTLARANPAQHKFVSRYSDPNHPTNSGSLISLLTGGYVNPMGLTEQLEQVRLGTRGRMGQSQKPNVKGTVKRMLKKDVMYLVIANMPTEQEMEAAKADLATTKSFT